MNNLIKRVIIIYLIIGIIYILVSVIEGYFTPLLWESKAKSIFSITSLATMFYLLFDPFDWVEN